MSNGGRADLLAFWRAVELFAPQPVPKVSDEQRVYRVDDGPLPWQDGHALRGEWIGDKQAWQHVVYCGIYSTQDAFEEIRARFPSERDAYDDGPPPGHSALAVFVLDAEGRAILGSEVLASCAWAIGRALLRGPGAVSTGSFEQAAARFGAEFEERFAAADDDEEAQELQEQGHTLGAPLSREDLEDCLELLGEILEIEELDGGSALRAVGEVRVASRRVSHREAHQAGERELLNSFYAADLGVVADAVRGGEYGVGLREYLTSAERIDKGARVDVERDLDHVRRTVSARRVPAGRWPSAPSEKLALGQQFALNAITASSEQRVFAVNGPPGTGKTVTLRDLLAAIVVERATLLAKLEAPGDAFVGKLGWSAGSYRRTVHRLRRELVGFEMVLACATNGAAENVSVEIPAAQAIDAGWHGEVDYFTDVASALLGASSRGDGGEEAWALVSAALGSRARNKAFASGFWFEGIKELLHDMEEPAQDWEQAVEDFRTAQEHAEEERENRAAYSDVFERLDEARKESVHEQRAAEALGARTLDAKRELSEARDVLARACDEHERCEKQYDDHRDARPGLWEWLRTAGAAGRRWRTSEARIAQALADAERAAGDAEVRTRRALAAKRALVQEADDQEERRQAAAAKVEHLERLLGEVREKWSAARPEVPFPDGRWEQPQERERREEHAPWIDEPWNEARTELFLAALRLHRAFVEGAAKEMHATLSATIDMLSGKAPSDLDPATALAAWQCLFLVVPLVSTTFASFPYLFRHLGREALGWLLIDEAGQATPQAAAGPIWRAQKVVVLGDPLQLEPISSLPFSIQTILREQHGIPGEWLPANPSVQALADQLARAGTFRGARGEEPIWVGAPLNVHRRCEEPMFAIVNDLAYQGQMINCTPARSELALPASEWIDVPGAPGSGNWIPAEGEVLDELLLGLQQHGVDFSEVFLISPFRDVARQIRRRARTYPGLTAGTIHTAQGREADVVILVLGGNPARPGARAWAAEKPNLLNVAVSRARRRLYVIGDRASWAKLPHFKVLAQALRATSGRRAVASEPQ